MKHVRFIPNDLCGLQVREDSEGKESRLVEGRAIVFGQRSVNLTPWSETRVVYEVLEPGCLTQDVLERSDVVFNLNHSNHVLNILGRYRNSKNDTLKLEIRKDGVYNSCDLPNTSAANDTLVLMRRGDISGQSFAFEDDWEDTENGVSYERTNEIVDGKEVWIRHVKRIVGIFDVSIVTYPAYKQTDVGTREADNEIDKAIDAQIQREANNHKDQQHRDCNNNKPSQNENTPEENDEEKAKRKAKENEMKERKEREAVATMRTRLKVLNLASDDLDF